MSRRNSGNAAPVGSESITPDELPDELLFEALVDEAFIGDALVGDISSDGPSEDLAIGGVKTVGASTKSGVVVTGDLTLASNYVQAEDMSERIVGSYGRFNTYITMSYSGAALIAQLLEEVSTSVSSAPMPPLPETEFPYTVCFDNIDLKRFKRAFDPGEPDVPISLLNAAQAFPLFTYVFRTFAQTKKAGAESVTWRIKDSLGANRPGFDVMTRFLLEGYNDGTSDDRASSDGTGNRKRGFGDKDAFINSGEAKDKNIKCVVINDANLGYRNRKWNWIDHLGEGGLRQDAFVVYKTRERKPLPAIPVKVENSTPVMSDGTPFLNAAVIKVKKKLDTPGNEGAAPSPSNDETYPEKEFEYRPVTQEEKSDSFTDVPLLRRLQKICSDRLVVIVPVYDLRRGGAAISTRVSWERTVQDIVKTSHKYLDASKTALANEEAKYDPFGGARFVVVTLGPDGAVLLYRHEEESKRRACLCFANETIEGSMGQIKPGGMRGYDTCVSASIAHFLAQLPSGYGSSKEEREKREECLFAILKPAVLVGVSAARTLHNVGLTKECEAEEINQRYKHLGVITAQNFYEAAKEGKASAKEHPLFFPFEHISKVFREGWSYFSNEVQKEWSSGDFSIDTHWCWDGDNLRVIDIPEVRQATHTIYPCVSSVSEQNYFDATWWSFASHYLVQRAIAIRKAVHLKDAKSAQLRSLYDKIDELMTYSVVDAQKNTLMPEAIQWVATETMARRVLRQGVTAFRASPSDVACMDRHSYASASENRVSSVDKVPSQIPYGKFGDLETVDRREIESLRNLGELFQQYCDSERAKRDRPLSVAVFGRAGGGKSYAVKQIFKSLDLSYEELTYNVAQFERPEQILQALHEVRDVSLRGKMPLVFWDEFDSNFGSTSFGWLQYFLAPMQDGQFQHGQRTHPTGRAIFVFAGSRFDSVDAITNPNATSDEGDERKKQWLRAKGKDFQSRLEGGLNIEGPEGAFDLGDGYVFLIRRALVIRSMLKRYFPELFGNGDTLRIDDDVSVRLLLARVYHGARSLEKLLLESTLGGRTRFDVSCLPADSQIGLHAHATDFEDGLRSEFGRRQMNFLDQNDHHALRLLLSYNIAKDGWI